MTATSPRHLESPRKKSRAADTLLRPSFLLLVGMLVLSSNCRSVPKWSPHQQDNVLNVLNYRLYQLCSQTVTDEVAYAEILRDLGTSKGSRDSGIWVELYMHSDWRGRLSAWKDGNEPVMIVEFRTSTDTIRKCPLTMECIDYQPDTARGWKRIYDGESWPR